MITVKEIPVPAELLAVPAAMLAVIPDIAEAVRTKIISLAHERLTTSSQDYADNVQPVRYHFPRGRIPTTGSVTVATIVLTGTIPNMVENGWPGGDMKPFLLWGRNSKQAKDGTRYNTVPFRHGTPEATGRNFPPMGSAYRDTLGREEAARLGRQVHREAKALKPTIRAAGGTKWGGRLRAGMAPRLREHHKTDLYAGMVRQQGAAGSTQYTTFRRVSERSDPQSWIHPGIEGRKLFEEAAEYTREVTADLMKAVLRG